MPDSPDATSNLDVAVLGAGISGLMAARQLVAGGRRVAVLEKGRVPGGRMATRRVGDAMFDYGAQYFTARDPVFQALVGPWLNNGAARAWSDGFATSTGVMKHDGEARYIGAEGMSMIPRRVAEGLPVHYGVTADAISHVDGRWVVRSRERAPISAAVLVLTAPVPQSLSLLAAGGVVLDAAAAVELTRIQYSPCLAALVRLLGPSQVPEPGGLWLDGEPIHWMGDNTQKGISEPRLGASVTLHASPDYSRDRWDADPDETGAELAASVQSWLGAEVTSVRLHRWRYSRPTVSHPARHLVARSPGPVIFAGDAFGVARVEGAALSGLSAGDAALAEG